MYAPSAGGPAQQVHHVAILQLMCSAGWALHCLDHAANSVTNGCGSTTGQLMVSDSKSSALLWAAATLSGPWFLCLVPGCSGHALCRASNWHVCVAACKSAYLSPLPPPPSPCSCSPGLCTWPMNKSAADICSCACVQGVPSHQKWFWTSRSVYMAVEPAYFYVMSGGGCRRLWLGLSRDARERHVGRSRPAAGGLYPGG